MTVILGIDPGSRCTGFGVVKTDGHRHRYVTSGNIKTVSDDMSERCYQIYTGITEIVKTYQPDEVGIEQVFVKHNPNSAIKLGQARGAALVAVAAYAIKVGEYSPRKIKQSVVGYGNADKSQVQQMIKLLLSLNDVPQVDAADALAIALCHANMRGAQFLTSSTPTSS